MPVQLQDSYIVQGRDLIQYLIGQIEADADGYASIMVFISHISSWLPMTRQYLIIEVK